jgi:fructose/tagatose bisphosphate aldolase
MSINTGRKTAEAAIERLREHRVSLAIFCTASHWNTEAILLAARNYAAKKGIRKIPLAVAMTYRYPHMEQAERITRSRDAKTGFLSIMRHLQTLCAEPDSPYADVEVLPHLDHADPARDSWALTEGLPWLASVMFDAQSYPEQENLRLTTEYVRQHGRDVLIEGILEQLAVAGGPRAHQVDAYIDKAVAYVRQTGIDFLVADLGTEQQTTRMGDCIYLKERARSLSAILGRPMLVLHGTSSLTEEQMRTLADDGIIRVNMWTRIARESGQYAAQRLLSRSTRIAAGDFEAAESRQYLDDSIDKAAEIMEGILDILGYSRLAE